MMLMNGKSTGKNGGLLARMILGTNVYINTPYQYPLYQHTLSSRPLDQDTLDQHTL